MQRIVSIISTFLKIRLYWFARMLSIVGLFSEQRVTEYGAQYKLFGGFALANYFFPYFMWGPSIDGSNTVIIYMRSLAALLCFFLVIKDLWPPPISDYMPLFWHFTLLYCLPFLTFFMLLYSHGTTYWLLNMILVMFLLGMLVDWLSFIIILIIGVVFGALFYYFMIGPIYMNLDFETINWCIYMYGFSFLIGIVFSRNKSKTEEAKLGSMGALGASIAHELRTPLVTMDMYNQVVMNTMANLKDNSKRSFSTLEAQNLDEIQAASKGLGETIRNAFSIIDMLLIKLRANDLRCHHLEKCSMLDCLNSCLSKYPLSPAERASLDYSNLEDFYFMGNPLLMEHVFLNLIKNALYHIKKSGKGSIIIYSQKDHKSNRLYFKDTGSGISSVMLPFIFKRFFTQTKHGTGIGLFFCKRAIQSFGGSIHCRSAEGQFTEFIICLPFLGHELYFPRNG